MTGAFPKKAPAYRFCRRKRELVRLAYSVYFLFPGSSHIGRLGEETREERVADEGVLISLMTAFGHGVGKECYIHVVSVFVFALIREPHDTVHCCNQKKRLRGCCIRSRQEKV